MGFSARQLMSKIWKQSGGRRRPAPSSIWQNFKKKAGLESNIIQGILRGLAGEKMLKVQADPGFSGR